MTRVISIPHFDAEKKLSSEINVDDIPPTKDERGFAKDGGFFFSMTGKDGARITMRVSDQEASFLIQRLQAMLERHTDKFVQISQSLKPTD